MERLTKRLEDGQVVFHECHGTCGTCDGATCYCIGTMVDRLAAYEDTGLEPEEIKDNMEMFRAYRHICAGHEPEHIRDLIQAEKDGRLIVLPCKVGDTVYVIGESCDFCETYLDEPERCMRCEKGHYVEERGFELWMLSELNESIFLTREEAEAALAGKGISE